MSDLSAQAYIDEGSVWSRLAALLPDPDDVDRVQGCWDIGEQEAGLDVLVGRLLEQELAIAEPTRAELAVMAAQWGVWDRLAAEIMRCRTDETDHAPLRVLTGTAAQPMPVRTVLPEHPTPDLFLVPWIACGPCGRTLARAHEREDWGDLSYVPEFHVVYAHDGSMAPQVFDETRRDAAWAALSALRTACRCDRSR
ncbi:hypothetical protein [Streptomyces sp. YIM S03343]